MVGRGGDPHSHSPIVSARNMKEIAFRLSRIESRLTETGAAMSDRILVVDPVDIETAGGVTFRCAREEVPSPCLPEEGEFATTETRWVFTANDGTRYIGPPASAASHLDSLGRLVAEWWSDQRQQRDAWPGSK